MSVTFCAEVFAPSAFVVTCGCAPVTAAAVRYDHYEVSAEVVRRLREEAREAMTDFAVLPGCEHPDHCSLIGPRTQPIFDDAGPDLNVSNANAKLLLDVLGYAADIEAGEYSGVADSEEFLGRILTALAVAPADAGAPWHRTTPRFIECGRRPGYLQEKLHALHEIALWCRDNRRRIQWA